MRKILIPVISLALCLSVIWQWTCGFSAFTVFSYTLERAGTNPRAFPEISMIDQDGHVFRLKDKHKFVLINFVYLNCPYVCHKVNNQIEQIYHLADPSLVPSQLQFITMSFDLKNDDIQKIRKYRSYFGKDIEGWSFTLPFQTKETDFANFLNKVGVWKYMVPSTGIINHSIYLFLVSPDQKIVSVFDPARQTNEQIIQKIESCIEEDSGD